MGRPRFASINGGMVNFSRDAANTDLGVAASAVEIAVVFNNWRRERRNILFSLCNFRIEFSDAFFHQIVAVRGEFAYIVFCVG